MALALHALVVGKVLPYSSREFETSHDTHVLYTLPSGGIN